MRNVFWLRPQIIAGRTGPNQDAWDPHELAGGGIGAILSVNDGELVHPQDLAAAGIAYAHIPLSDKSPPEPGDFDTCVAALPKALEFAMTSVESDRSVLVHCRAGKDRTGMFLSYFLCKTEGLPPREAVLEVKRVRPIALTAQGWDLFTHQVLETLVA